MVGSLGAKVRSKEGSEGYEEEKRDDEASSSCDEERDVDGDEERDERRLITRRSS